jgi:chromosome segregation ATPase
MFQVATANSGFKEERIMAQESYADFSIIQKYLDQKKTHDETTKKYQDKISELENSIAVLKDELDARDQAISQLNTQLEEKSTQLKEKDKGMQELNIQIHRLKKQAGTSQETEIESSAEENNNKKAKFSFLK